MVKKQTKPLLLFGALIFIVWVYSMGGIPFLGALILFEEGNEIIFRGEETVITKEIDPSTGENITETFAAITDVERQLKLESKYIEDASMRFFGTAGITNARIDIAYNIQERIEEEVVITSVEENLWIQPANFSEIVQLDITQYLSGKEEGAIITFKFHSDNPGSLIISTFNVEWGPTNAQIALCDSTGGTFSEATLSCECPSDAIDSSLETGCQFEETPPLGDGSTGGTTTSAPSPQPTLQLQAITPDFGRVKTTILAVIMLLLIYYKGFEQGPKRGFFKK